MTRVKICGVGTAAHAMVAAEAGADFIGMIFAPSPRQVTVEQARLIVDAVRGGEGRTPIERPDAGGGPPHLNPLPQGERRPDTGHLNPLPQGERRPDSLHPNPLPRGERGPESRAARPASRPKMVGVFVNAEPDTVNTMALAAGLDMVQLSGDEEIDDLAGIELPVIKAIHISGREPAEVAMLGLRRTLARIREAGAIPLLDAKVTGMYGGTGRAFDWEIAREVAQDFDFLMGGGMTPDNVGRAVQQVHPWGVDVASGVETGGVKDPAKVRAFIQAVRGAQPA